MLCHAAYHAAATMLEEPPEVLFEELLEGVLGGAATRLQVGTAKISLASSKERRSGNME